MRYLQGEKRYDKTQRTNDLPSNAGLPSDPEAPFAVESDDEIVDDDKLPGFHFEGRRPDDNRGIVRQRDIDTDTFESRPYVGSSKEYLHLNPENTGGNLHISIHMDQVEDENTFSQLKEMGTTLIKEIWVNANDVQISRRGKDNATMLFIHADKKGASLLMTLDDFFRMAVVRTDNQDEFQIELQKTTIDSPEELRALNLLFDRLRINGLRLGSMRSKNPSDNRLIPVFHFPHRRTKSIE
mgnify:CR=1 FL=1